MKCKVTNKIIKPFMSFGKMPLADGFLKKEDFDKEFFFDFEVEFSEELSLFQLKEEIFYPKVEHGFPMLVFNY